MKLILLVFIMFDVARALAVDVLELTVVQETLNQTFLQSIQEHGFSGFEIIPDEAMGEYAGGVNVVDNKIRFIVGAKILTAYPLPAFMFISCHELGHMIGGAPFKTKGAQYQNLKVSTEGQADYWAGQVCLETLTSEPILAGLSFFTFMSESLRDIVGDSPFYAVPVLNKTEDFFYDSEYSSFQCRFNTVVAGVRKEARPSCWFR